MNDITQEFTGLIEERFGKFTESFQEKQPYSLYEPLYYTMQQSGKRIRPLLLLSACHMFGGDVSKAIEPAFGIELFHNFTLLHDDIMDNAAVRRGKPSVFKKFGLNAGILSGDTMHLVSSEYVLKVDTDLIHKVLSLFVQTGIEVCEGQQHDIDFEERTDVRAEEYIKMIEYKTSVLLACSLKIGAMLARTSEANQNAIYEFGRNIGIAFQLQDDYLDTFGNFELVGKKIGGDIAQNKKTFLLIKALEKAEGDTRDELLQLISQSDDSDRKINRVIEIYNELGIKEETKNLMQQYYQTGIDSLNSLEITNEAGRKFLQKLAEKIITRDH